MNHALDLSAKSNSWKICFLQNRESDISEIVLLPPFLLFPYVKKIDKTRSGLKKYTSIGVIEACFKYNRSKEERIGCYNLSVISILLSNRQIWVGFLVVKSLPKLW